MKSGRFSDPPNTQNHRGLSLTGWSQRLSQVNILSSTTSFLPSVVPETSVHATTTATSSAPDTTAQSTMRPLSWSATANDLSNTFWSVGATSREFADSAVPRLYNKLISLLTPRQAAKYQTFYKLWWVVALLWIGIAIIAAASSHVVRDTYTLCGYLPEELERLRLARVAGTRYDPATRATSRYQRRTTLHRLQAMIRSIDVAWGSMFALTASSYFVAMYHFSKPGSNEAFIDKFNDAYVWVLCLILVVFLACPSLAIVFLRAWILPHAGKSEMWLCPRSRFPNGTDLGADTTDDEEGEHAGEKLREADGRPTRRVTTTTTTGSSAWDSQWTGSRRAKMAQQQALEGLPVPGYIDLPLKDSMPRSRSTRPSSSSRHSRGTSNLSSVPAMTHGQRRKWDIPPPQHSFSPANARFPRESEDVRPVDSERSLEPCPRRSTRRLRTRT